MKRFALLLIAVLLTGCTALGSAASVSSGSKTAPDPVQNSETLVYFGLPGDISTAVSRLNGTGFFDYCYHLGDYFGCLTRYDLNDMTQHILCDREGCTHMDETCDSYSTGWQVIAMPDAVYTVDYEYLENPTDGQTLARTYTLVRRDADGMHPEPVASIGGWQFFGADEHYLYGFSDGTYGRVDRTNGTETLLLHAAESRYQFYGQILGVWNGQFVVVHWDKDSTHIANLSLLSTEGVETTLTQIDGISIFEDTIIPYSYALLGDKVYYTSDDGILLCYDLSKGEHLESSNILQACAQNGTVNMWSLHAADDHLLVSLLFRPDGEENLYWRRFALSMPDQTLTELTLKEEFRNCTETASPEEGLVWEPELILPLAQVDGQFLVCNAYQFFQRSYIALDGTTAFSDSHFSIFAMIDPQDYFASRPAYREFIPLAEN